MKNIFTLLLILAIATLLTQIACNNSKTSKAPEQDKFVGAWASDIGGREGTSIYIEKTGEIYKCYFISDKGAHNEYKGIIENNDIKIGNQITIKYLNENKAIYVVESAMQFQKMRSIEEKIDEIQKDINEVDGANIGNSLFIPFEDGDANASGLTPNFSLTYRNNIYEGAQKLFDKNVKTCFLNPELVSHYDLQKQGVDELSVNWLLPWEYQIRCSNSAGRNLTFVFSIRYNEYKIVRLQMFS